MPIVSLAAAAMNKKALRMSIIVRIPAEMNAIRAFDHIGHDRTCHAPLVKIYVPVLLMLIDPSLGEGAAMIGRRGMFGSRLAL
jgi:hypothetical protein